MKRSWLISLTMLVPLLLLATTLGCIVVPVDGYYGYGRYRWYGGPGYHHWHGPR